MNEPEIIYPKNKAEWEEWLEQNHLSQKSVWVVFYSKSSQKPSLTWSEAVEVALCFGWIDSKKVKKDHETSHQYFSPRKPRSIWSKINKNKIQQLTAEGRMRPAGVASIAIAQQNGYWTILDEAEDLIIPRDLASAFEKHPGSQEYFSSLSKSIQKMSLSWIAMARRPDTRQKRIDEVAQKAGQRLIPKQF